MNHHSLNDVAIIPVAESQLSNGVGSYQALRATTCARCRFVDVAVAIATLPVDDNELRLVPILVVPEAELTALSLAPKAHTRPCLSRSML